AGGAGGYEAALVDDDEVVDEAFDEVELMAGEEHRGTGGGEGAEHVEGAFDGGGVEPGERLVEDEDLRGVDEGGGDLDLLLVTGADRFEGVGRFAPELELFEQLETASLRRLSGQAVEAGEVDELIDDRHLRVEAALFGHIADRTAMVGGDRCAVDRDRPGIGGQHPEQDPH